MLLDVTKNSVIFEIVEWLITSDYHVRLITSEWLFTSKWVNEFSNKYDTNVLEIKILELNVSHFRVIPLITYQSPSSSIQPNTYFAKSTSSPPGFSHICF